MMRHMMHSYHGSGHGSETDESDRKDFESAHDRMLSLAGSLRGWLEQKLEGAVYWLERTGSRRGLDRVTLAATPIDVGQSLRQVLYQSDMIRSVVMTSATLATGEDDSFSFFRSRIGLSGGQSVRVGQLGCVANGTEGGKRRRELRVGAAE